MMVMLIFHCDKRSLFVVYQPYQPLQPLCPPGPKGQRGHFIGISEVIAINGRKIHGFLGGGYFMSFYPEINGIFDPTYNSFLDPPCEGFAMNPTVSSIVAPWKTEHPMHIIVSKAWRRDCKDGDFIFGQWC